MQQNCLALVAIACVFLNCFITTDAQSPSTVAIYVDSQSPSPAPDGNLTSPFLSISDAFNYIINSASSSSSPIPQAIIYLTLNNDTYTTISDEVYDFDSSIISSLNITASPSSKSSDNTYISDMPLLDLRETSLAFKDLTFLSIQGIAITAKEDAFLITNTQVMLQNVRFNSYTRSAETMIRNFDSSSIHLDGIEIHMYTPGAFLYYSVSSLGLVNQQNVTMNNISVVVEELNKDIGQHLFTMEATQRILRTGILSLTGFTVTTGAKLEYTDCPLLISTSGFELLTMSDIQIINQSVVLSNTDPIILVELAGKTIMKGIKLNNNTLRIASESSLISIYDVLSASIEDMEISYNDINIDPQNKAEAIYDSLNNNKPFSVVDFKFSKDVNLSNHSVIGNSLSTPLLLNFISNDMQMESIDLMDLKLNIEHINITGNMDIKLDDNGSTSGSLTFINVRKIVIDKFTLDDVEYRNNNLSSYVFMIKPEIPESINVFTSSFAPKEFVLSNMRIQNNSEACNLTFLYFIPSHDQREAFGCLQPAEFFSLYMQNLTVSNNSLIKNATTSSTVYSSSLFQLRQTQIHLNQFRFEHNNLSNYHFITIGPKPCTIIIMSSYFGYNNLYSSQFIAGAIAPQFSCSFIGNEYVTALTPLYRYTFILDSIFESNELKYTTLINTANGFISVHNNTINKEYLVESQYLTVFSIQPLEELQYVTFTRDSSLEDATLKTNTYAQQKYYAIMTNVSRIQNDTVYFTSITMNRIASLGLSSPRFSHISSVDVAQNTVLIEGNSFTDSRTGTWVRTTLFVLENVRSIAIIKNSFEDTVNIDTYFDLSQKNMSSLLEVYSNRIDKCHLLEFVTFKAISTKGFNFSNNLVRNTIIYSNLISLDISFASKDFPLDNNTVLNSSLKVGEVYETTIRPAIISIVCMLLGNKSTVSVTNSLFENINILVSKDASTTSKPGIFYLETYQSINIYNVTIRNVTLETTGNLIWINGITEFLLKNSRIEKINNVGVGGLINSAAYDTMIFNTTIENYSTNSGLGVFLMTVATINQKFKVINSTFRNLNTYKNGSILSIPIEIFSIGDETAALFRSLYYVTLGMSNTILDNVNSIFNLPEMKCTSCYFENITAVLKEESELFSFDSNFSGDVLIRDIRIDASKSFGTNPLIRVRNSDLNVKVDDIKYQGSYNNLTLASINSGSFTLNNSEFSGIKLLEHPFIEVRGPYEEFMTYVTPRRLINVNILNSKFHGISAEHQQFMFEMIIQTSLRISPESESRRYTPLIFVSSLANINVDNCEFTVIRNIPVIMYSVSAQAFNFKLPSKIYIQDSKFSTNSFDTGSALLVKANNIVPYDAFDINVTVKNSVFDSNEGKLGGAMFVYNSSLTIIDSRFEYNLAKLEGSSMYLGGSSEDKTKLINTTFKSFAGSKVDEIGYEPTKFNMTFVPSGKTGMSFDNSNLFAFRVITIKNVSASELQSGYFRLDFLDAFERPARDFSMTSKASFTVYGNEEFNVSNYFNAQLSRSDGYSQNVSMTNVVIGGNGTSYISVAFTYISDRFDTKVILNLQIRPCLPGEYNDTVMCYPCPLHTYSFEPKHFCTECPQNAVCVDGNQVLPMKGFWNSGPKSDIIHDCLPGKCSNDDNKSSCTTGYAGPKCEGCDFDNSYVENGYLKCNICKDVDLSLLLSIFVGVLYSCYQIFSIYILYSGIRKVHAPGKEFLILRKSERSYYIKSLLTYTQLMSILYVSSYTIYDSLGLSLQIGNPSTLITYGTQCSMIALGVKSEDFLYYETYFQVILPIVQFAAISLGTRLAAIYNSRLDYKKIVSISAIYLILSNQPGIVNSLGIFMSCESLEGLDYRFIKAHPNWSCDTDRYKNVRNFFVIPNLVIWCAVVPAGFLLILIKNRQRFTTTKAKSSLGVLTASLKVKYYYWSIVLMGLKLSLGLLAFVFQQNVAVKIFITISLLWAYQSSVRWLKPYGNAFFNTFQTIIISLLIFNVIVFEFLIDAANEPVLSKMVLIICVALNIGTILFMLWKILSLSFVTILAFIEEKILKKQINRTPSAVSAVSDTDTLKEKLVAGKSHFEL